MQIEFEPTHGGPILVIKAGTSTAKHYGEVLGRIDVLQDKTAIYTNNAGATLEFGEGVTLAEAQDVIEVGFKKGAH